MRGLKEILKKFKNLLCIVGQWIASIFTSKKSLAAAEEVKA